MRTLTLSLIATVITATIGLGLLIGWLYDEIAVDSAPQEEYSDFIELSQQFATLFNNLYTLYSSELPTEDFENNFTQSWNEYPFIELTLEESDSLALPPSLTADFEKGKTILLEGESNLLLYIQLAQQNKILLLEIPQRAQSHAPNLQIALTLLFYIGVISSIALWLLPLLKRLNLLDSHAKKFGEGNLTTRMPTKGFTYIKNIETAFNTMASQIQQLIADNKLLSRAVSHDLKTPLSRLRFGLDTLAEENRPEKREAYLNRLDVDLDHMESLINTLLDYARLEENQLALPIKLVDLSGFIADYVNCFKLSCHAQIRTALHHSISIKANQNCLTMLMQNLLTNAEKFSVQKIQVTLESINDWAFIYIDDDGPGIPEVDRERMLKPFQKSEAVNSHSQTINNHKKTTSHGMGLAICSRIVEWLGGDIQLGQSEQLGGASVRVKLPIG